MYGNIKDTKLNTYTYASCTHAHRPELFDLGAPRTNDGAHEGLRDEYLDLLVTLPMLAAPIVLQCTEPNYIAHST